MGMPFTVLMPVIASDFLNGGSHTFGFLMGSMGLGALIGALYLASRHSVLGLWRIITLSAASFGLGLFILSISRSSGLSLVLMFAIGLSMILSTASCNTLIQTIVDEDKRARIMGFFSMAMLGTFPIGSLLAGSMADIIGVTYTLMFGGVSCLVGSLVFAWRLPMLMKDVRPVYAGMGIIVDRSGSGNI
jgi:MFS family permease